VNARRDGTVLVCHAISGDSHVARHDAADAPGWWDLMVGPGRPIDTGHWFVICANVLGGCRGTTGPNSIDPRSGRPYGADFPTVTVADMVAGQRRLVDHLGIDALHAVIGGSLGGHQAITWALAHPERVRGCVALASSPRLTSQAIAFDVVGRNAILNDPGYQGGQYYDRGVGPATGLALARMLAHVTYLSREAMTAKFDPGRLQPREVATAFEQKFSVGSYLAYQGHKFVERFDANSYVTLSMAMDLFDLGETQAALRAAFARSRCRWLVVSFTSDWLFPAGAASSSTRSSRSTAASIFATWWRPAATTRSLSRRRLPRRRPDQKRSSPVSTPRCAAAGVGRRGGADERLPRPAARLRSHPRADRAGRQRARRRLRRRPPVTRARGHTRLVGVEDRRGRAPRRGAARPRRRAVRLEHGLSPFRDGQFDVVVLSQTLQSVGHRAHRRRDRARRPPVIVSFPNFAYHKLRRMLADDGRSPNPAGRTASSGTTPQPPLPSSPTSKPSAARRASTSTRCTSTATRRWVTDDRIGTRTSRSWCWVGEGDIPDLCAMSSWRRTFACDLLARCRRIGGRFPAMFVSTGRSIAKRAVRYSSPSAQPQVVCRFATRR
jgi:homoserine O-acetyltransferase